MLEFDYTNSFVKKEEILKYSDEVNAINAEFEKKKNNSDEFLGWIDLPHLIDKEEYSRIKDAAKKIQKDTDILLCIGIGGSYLGAEAVIQALSHKYIKRPVEVLFVGNNLSTDHILETLEYIEEKDISINVISKSGTTLEPAIAFRIFREYLNEKYGPEEARKRIYITTDKSKGALKTLANEEKIETFVIPDNIGGRFSVLTAVGLLPIAAAGFDIDLLLDGAKEAANKYNDPEIKYNDSYLYAAIRHYLNTNKEKDIEIMVTYNDKLKLFIEWFKQLFGESEGKDNKGIFPTGVTYTTDLHSLGQIVQDGKRNIFETVIKIKNEKDKITIKKDSENYDGLNYLQGKTVKYVEDKAMEGTIKAHIDGDVPNLLITIDELNEKSLGNLIYFFEKAVAMSGRLLDVNPFNQPGVEAYKKNMFKLLDKPE